MSIPNEIGEGHMKKVEDVVEDVKEVVVAVVNTVATITKVIVALALVCAGVEVILSFNPGFMQWLGVQAQLDWTRAGLPGMAPQAKADLSTALWLACFAMFVLAILIFQEKGES
jgi:hypothetical protein